MQLHASMSMCVCLLSVSVLLALAPSGAMAAGIPAEGEPVLPPQLGAFHYPHHYPSQSQYDRRRTYSEPQPQPLDDRPGFSQPPPSPPPGPTHPAHPAHPRYPHEPSPASQPQPQPQHHIRHELHRGGHHLAGGHHMGSQYGHGHLAGGPSPTPSPSPGPPGLTNVSAVSPGGPGGAPACTLSADQLAAAAQATVSRTLEGICNERELRDKFHNLESQLADQFNVIKTMILNLEDKVGAMDIGMERSERRLLAAISSKSRCNRAGAGGGEDDSGDDLADGADDGDTSASATLRDDDDEYLDGDANPALVTTQREGAQGPGAREEEVARLNNTVHTEYAPQGSHGSTGNAVAGCGHGRRVFTYYWRVRNMNYKLTGWNQRRSVRSQSFYIWPGGYRMYMRMYPRQSGENVYVHVGLTRGDYDNALQWPFRLKHRLAVVDQVTSIGGPGPVSPSRSPPQDLVSRLWDPTQLCSGFNWQQPTAHTPDNYECVGLGFPQKVLRTRDYIRQDSTLLKLTVCLDQP